MSQRIAIDCDMHLARDEVVPGRPFDLAIRESGGGFRFLTIDLCEDCSKPLGELFDEVAERGREFTGDLAEAIKPKRGRPRVGAEDNHCPVCGSQHSTRDALRKHVRVSHKQTMAEATNDADVLTCDVCAKTFRKGQGLASHRRISHPDVPKRTVAEIQAEAREDG